MSLVFAAITPHSPVLVPAVGKEHLARLKKTVKALGTLEHEIYAAQPDTIVIISPHGAVEAEHFTLDFNEQYTCDLKEFGVFETQIPCRVDMRLAHDLREIMEDRDIPFMMSSGHALDYGVVVPLTYLTAHMPSFSVLPLYPSLLPAKTHFEFGRAVQEVIQHSNRRVAVIASADLSHRLTRSSPAGYSPYGKRFDDLILQLIANRNSSGLINFDKTLADRAAQCGLSPLVILSGVLDRIEAAPDILCYESPFGIGCMTARYRFA